MGRSTIVVSPNVGIGNSERNAMPTADVHIQEVTERERIEQWRAEELERAGYAPDDAAELAMRHDVDLHLAVELLAQGCPPETALRILL
jgi:hypothetical protein